MYDIGQEFGMKRRFGFSVILMSFCLLACSIGEKGEPVADAEASGGVTWAQLTLDESQAQAANENKLIMIDVFSPT